MCTGIEHLLFLDDCKPRVSRSGCPLSNLSVCFAASSPSREASGEEARLSGMPRPPLDRGGGTASAVTERLSPAKASRLGCPSSNLSVCFAASSPSRGASGEEARLSGMPRPPLGRQRRRPPPVAETGSRCWGCGQQDASDSEADAGSRNPVSGTASAVTERFLHFAITYYSSDDEY